MELSSPAEDQPHSDQAVPPEQDQQAFSQEIASSVPQQQPRYQVRLTVDVAPGQSVRVTLNAPPNALPEVTAVASTAVHSVIRGTAPGVVQVTASLPGQEGGISIPVQVENRVDSSLLPPQEPVAAAEPEARKVSVPASPSKAAKSSVNSKAFTWLKAVSVRKVLVSTNFLFGLGIAIYLLIHLIHLADFPIYFTADEAACTVYGSDLINSNLRDNYGEFLPTYFKHDDRYNMGILVYMQAFVVLFAGKSIFASRLVIVLSSLLGAVWISLILRDIFKKRYWWLGVMFLAVTPSWFLFSRGVYDVCLMASLFAGFIYYYSLYRLHNPRYLYPALVLGALTFYSYPAGQVVMVLMGILLFLVDIRYHWQHRRTALIGLGVLLLLSLPFVRFMISHPTEYAYRVQQYGSYLGQDISLLAKTGLFAGKALTALNPFYWFFPNSQDWSLYVMKGYGHMLWPMLPFALWGLWQTIRGIRAAENRIILLALLVSPVAPALVTMAVYRALEIIIPFILLTLIGFSAFLEWLAKKRIGADRWAAAVTFVAMAAFSFFMLSDALVNGPTWFRNYGLDGMQYGARQVFQAAEQFQKQHPDLQVVITPNWTFQSEVLRRFFLPESSPIRMGTADAYLSEIKPDLEKNEFVFIPDDYQKIVNSGWFKEPQVDQLLPYPDGSPGFYFVHLQYQDNVAQIAAAEKERRQRLLEQDITLDGQVVHVSYPLLDIAPIDNVFDGKLDSLIKTSEVNPLVINMEFTTARQMSSLTAHVGSETVDLTVVLTGEDGVPLGTFTQRGENGSVDGYKDVTIDFGGVKPVKKLHFEMLDTYAPNPSPVHLWEITFR
jgi:hypothetical protein